MAEGFRQAHTFETDLARPQGSRLAYGVEGSARRGLECFRRHTRAGALTDIGLARVTSQLDAHVAPVIRAYGQLGVDVANDAPSAVGVLREISQRDGFAVLLRSRRGPEVEIAGEGTARQPVTGSFSVGLSASIVGVPISPANVSLWPRVGREEC